MSESGWPEENWVVLGEQIAKARRAKGWDQQELARRSGNSPNTISNYERGRATRSRRVPGGIHRVEQALGWPPDAAKMILAGEDPDSVINQPSLLDLFKEKYEEESRAAESAVDVDANAALTRVGLMSERDIELTQSGHLAQDTFIRQMKRYRKLQNVSIEELAKRIAELGANVELKDLERLENGTRLLRMSEAEVIARALGTTVDWLLGSGFSSDAPDEMKVPPTDEELQAEAKAVERRIFDLGARVNRAHAEYAHARQRAEEARQQAEMQMVILQQATHEKADMERQYHYLLGRIDSLRAAKGEEQIVQTYPVYESSGADVPGRRTIGAQLAEGRKRLEMTIEDTYLLTRIPPVIIEAIERDDFKAATGGYGNRVAAHRFIRELARAYGIDPAPLLQEYDVAHRGQVASRKVPNQDQ